MRHLKVAVVALLLTGCGKKFSQILAGAEKDFAQKNYIDTIDALNDGLLRWKESDGRENRGRAYELLGASYHHLRNTDKAIEAYQQAVQLSTKAYNAAYDMGILYLAKSQPEAAKKAFQMTLAMQPDDPRALLGLGNCYFAEKKYAEAKDAFERVLDVSPGVREAMDGLDSMKSFQARRAAQSAVSKNTAPAQNMRFKAQRKRR